MAINAEVDMGSFKEVEHWVRPWRLRFLQVSGRGGVISGERSSHEGMEGVSGHAVFVEASFNYSKGRNLLKSSVVDWWRGQEIKLEFMEIKIHGRTFKSLTYERLITTLILLNLHGEAWYDS